MISQETAAKIWNTQREIKTAEDLLVELKRIEEDNHDDHDNKAPNLRDAFGHKRHFQLGVPSGENAHSLYDVSPELAKSVIRSHIENKKAELVEANEQARMELGVKK